MPFRHAEIGTDLSNGSSYMSIVVFAVTSSGMFSSAFPVIGCEPFFKVKEPSRRPRNECSVDAHRANPFVRFWQVQAKACWIFVDVRKRAALGQQFEIRLPNEYLRYVVLFEPDFDRVFPR